MGNTRKRRAGAKEYVFNYYGCKDVIIKEGKKIYVYETILIEKAKKLLGYTQPVYSLYRDLHKSSSAKLIYGIRAICAEDFNNEGFLCKVNVNTAEGTDGLFMEDELE